MYFFFFNDTATTEIYTLSLHDALPILRLAVSRSRPPALVADLAERLGAELVAMGSAGVKTMSVVRGQADAYVHGGGQYEWEDRKSTRLNSSHANISYAVFCLKKKKKTQSSSTTISTIY